eukprot:jgi/Mesvir1/6807/Mv09002-RA.5
MDQLCDDGHDDGGSRCKRARVGEAEVGPSGLPPATDDANISSSTRENVTMSSLLVHNTSVAVALEEGATTLRQPPPITAACSQERQPPEAANSVMPDAAVPARYPSMNDGPSSQQDCQLPLCPQDGHAAGGPSSAALDTGEMGVTDAADLAVHAARKPGTSAGCPPSSTPFTELHVRASMAPDAVLDRPLRHAGQCTPPVCQNSDLEAATVRVDARESISCEPLASTGEASLQTPVPVYARPGQQLAPEFESAPVSEGPGPPVGGPPGEAHRSEAVSLAYGHRGVDSAGHDDGPAAPPGPLSEVQAQQPGGQHVFPGPMPRTHDAHGPTRHEPTDAPAPAAAMAAESDAGDAAGGGEAVALDDANRAVGGSGGGGGRSIGAGDNGGSGSGGGGGSGSGGGSGGGSDCLRNNEVGGGSASTNAHASTSERGKALDNNDSSKSLANNAVDDDEDGEGMPCPICLETMTSSGDHQTCCLKCGHLFGKICILQWLRRSRAKCPACNAPAKGGDVRVIYAGRAIKVVDASADVAAMQRKLEEERANRARVEAQASLARNKVKAMDDDMKRLKRDLARTQALLSVANQQTAAHSSSWHAVGPPLVPPAIPLEFLRSCFSSLTAASMGAPLGPTNGTGWAVGQPQAPFPASLGPGPVQPDNRAAGAERSRPDALQGPGVGGGDYQGPPNPLHVPAGIRHTADSIVGPAARFLDSARPPDNAHRPLPVGGMVIFDISDDDVCIVEPRSSAVGRGLPGGSRSAQGGPHGATIHSVHGGASAGGDSSFDGQPTPRLGEPSPPAPAQGGHLPREQLGPQGACVGPAPRQLHSNPPAAPWSSSTSRTPSLLSTVPGPTLSSMARPAPASSMAQRAAPVTVGLWQAPTMMGAWQHPASTPAGPLPAFSLKASLAVTNARVMDMASSAQLLVLSEEIDRGPRWRKVSVLDPHRGSQSFQLPGDSGATRDLRLSRTSSPAGMPTLLLVAGFGKMVSIVSLDNGYPVVKFRTQAPVWSCEWNREDPNIAFAGLADGTVLQLDMRHTRGPVVQTQAPKRQPVHSLFHTSGAEWSRWASQGAASEGAAAGGPDSRDRGSMAALFSRKGTSSDSSKYPSVLVAATLSEVWTSEDLFTSSPATLFRPEVPSACTSLALDRDTGTLVASFRAPALAQTACDVARPAQQGCHFVFTPAPASQSLDAGVPPMGSLDPGGQVDHHDVFSGTGGLPPPCWRRAAYVPTGSVSNSVMSRSSIVLRSKAGDGAGLAGSPRTSPTPLLASGDDSCNGVRLLRIFPPPDRTTSSAVGGMDNDWLLPCGPHPSPVLDVRFVPSLGGDLLASLSTSRLHLYA